MATTSQAVANQLIKFRGDYFRAYLRETKLMPFMGAGQNKAIVMYRDLNDEGRELQVPIVYPIKNRGVGTGNLSGNESAIANEALRILPVWRRNGVEVRKSEQKRASIDLYKAQREGLRDWSTWDLKYSLLTELTTVAVDTARFNDEDGIRASVPYHAANATQRNTFLTASADRVLFGNTEANLVAGNYASSLANIAAAQTFSRAVIDLAKAMATRESFTDGRVNAIRPVSIRATNDDNVEKYVIFAGTRAFNRLKTDIETANLDGRVRGLDNVVFAGGVLEYNGVVTIEVPELDTVGVVPEAPTLSLSSLGPVGASSAQVETVFMLGAQALAVAWGQEPIFTTDEQTDYGFLRKVGIEENRGIQKVLWANRQHGMMTIHVAR